MAELKIGEISKPRFEFRSFGQCFCEAHKRMARLSVPVPEKVWERESDEIYIISRKNDINHTKLLTVSEIHRSVPPVIGPIHPSYIL